MSSNEMRQFVLAEIPQGKLTNSNFKLETAPIPTPGDGEILVKTRYISLDAANRAWMQGATYRDAIEGGQVMAGGILGDILESNDPTFQAGDLISADGGWREYAALPGSVCQKQPHIEPKTHLLSIYGVTGLTAYFGFLEICQPKAGETVLVSAAAGAVGTIVGQIAKIKGCRVVGTAGSDEKCDWLVNELGFDAAVNYRNGSVFKDLKEACPNGIDCYFDNTGGEILEAALFQMNMYGRISCCGAVSSYDGAPPQAGPRGVPGLLVVKRLTMRGFIVSDFFAGSSVGTRTDAINQLKEWVDAGKIHVLEDIVDGFENVPDALIGLLAGENRGKRIVRVND
jgi:NADPH-dependent curcumin reductase CurA